MIMSRDEDRAAVERLLDRMGQPALPPPPVAYCVQCKQKREIHMPRNIKMRNGKPAIVGDCPTCGAKVFTFSVLPYGVGEAKPFA